MHVTNRAFSSRRTELAATFSALRRARPTVPFWHLAAHRIPTLWSLYRGLLRAAPFEHIRWRIQTLFRLNKNLTSPLVTKTELAKGYRWLAAFQKALQGDQRRRIIVDRYNRLIKAEREREQWKAIFRDESRWIQKMRNRPILTGAIMRPSLFNRPLPRLKPQPVHISGMIRNRRKARELRLEKQALLTSWKNDLGHESIFEAKLYKEVQKHQLCFERMYENINEWYEYIDKLLDTIAASYQLDQARARTPYSPALLDMVKEARREKIRNKTRERERERKGEILRSTIERMRKGPPAHILSRMTPEQRRIDRIVRGASEGGYAARIKRAAGMKLRDDQTWRREDGEPHMQAELDKLERAIRTAQEQKRLKNDALELVTQ